MANVYFKVLNRNIRNQYAENIISGLQKELSASAMILNEDLFDVSRTIGTHRVGLNVDSLLKYYLINQILRNMPEENKEKNIVRKLAFTPNKKYKKDLTTNKYYELYGKEWVLAKDVVQVNQDGSYIINETKTNSTYVYKKVYSVNDALLSIQVIDPEGRIVNNMNQAIELIGLRKELAKRFKYSGYSGNSNDLVAAVLNQLSGPVETGYYMDNHYNLFKWDSRKKTFIRRNSELQLSPLLIDYDFRDNRCAIRKEYTGAR